MLANLSKTWLVVIALVGGTFLIILFDPPRTVCDTQAGIFKKQVGSLIFIQGKNFKGKQSKVEQQLEKCKFTNSLGGCYELFSSYRNLITELSTIPNECLSQVGNLKQVKNTLWDSVELMARLAWGEKPPVSYTQRQGWFSQADMALFCRLQNYIVKIYGKQKWNEFREKILTELPEAKFLTREKSWPLSIFSLRCSRLL